MVPTVPGVLDRVRRLRPEGWLLAAAAVLVLLLGVQGVRYVGARRLGRGLTESLTVRRPAAVRRATERPLAAYDGILEKGILGPPRTRSAPAPALVFGILGDTALIGTDRKKAKRYRLGETTSGGERLVEILTDRVVLEREGKRWTVWVFPTVGERDRPVTSAPAPAGRSSGRSGEV